LGSICSEKYNPADLLMDEFSVPLVSSFFNQIKDCGPEIEFVIEGNTTKFQVMDVGVNKTFKVCVL
jgi:hypothetical protein